MDFRKDLSCCICLFEVQIINSNRKCMSCTDAQL